MDSRKIAIIGDNAAALVTALAMSGEATIVDGQVLNPENVHVDLDAGTIHVKESVAPSDGLPNRLSIEKNSPFYTNCGAYVLVMLDGHEVRHCVEYNVEMGWVRVGNPDSNGRVNAWSAAKAEKQFGKVEVSWRYKPSRQVRRQIARIGK